MNLMQFTEISKDIVTTGVAALTVRAGLAVCSLRRCAGMPDKKKKVPSDLISSPLTTGMHGIEPRKQERRTSRLSATLRTVFASPQDQTPSGTPLAASRPGPDARNGFSLARNSYRLSAASIAGSKFPACHFASLPTWGPCPFGLSAPLPRFRFAPITAASTLQARCTSSSRFGLPRPPPPLPFRIFGSLRIKAFSDVCCLPVRLANPPDLPSLPDALTC